VVALKRLTSGGRHVDCPDAGQEVTMAEPSKRRDDPDGITRDQRSARTQIDRAGGDAGDHGPPERTARDDRPGHAQASDVERATGTDAAATTRKPAPPPREGEDPDAADGELAAEEFRDDQRTARRRQS
jgi:hypothetical protein